MINLKFADNSDRLNPFKQKIEKVFHNSIEKIISKIPVDNVVVVVWDRPESCIPEIGIGGYAPNATSLEVYMNPEFSNFDKVVEKDLIHTLAHELHHCLRWKDPGYGNTLLQAMIAEGLADHFDIEITGCDIPMWSNALSGVQIDKMKERAKVEYNNNNYNHPEWFFGSKDKDIPRWTGYTLGFHLVKDYLNEHPSQKASTLYNLRAMEFR